jgi:peptide/nickel transport system permease protein
MSKPAIASASAVDASLPAEDSVSSLHGLRRWLLGGGGLIFSLLVTFFGLLLVTFVIGRLMPADPVLAAVGDRASLSTYNQVRAEMGLDLPIWHQFLIYAWKVLHGDFGMSILTAQPVLDDIRRVFPATAELATVGIIIGIVFGIPLGVWSAVYRNSLLDHVMRVLGLIGYSVPIFWLGIMGLLVFYLKLEWVGGPGRLDVYLDGQVPTVTGMILVDSLLAGDWEVFDNAFSHIILPATLLGYYSLAYICRMTRSLMLEQLNHEYLITARVKGLSERRVIWRHAFGNIQVPLITVVALAFANILEGSVLTETVFAWPGIGRYITTALLAADMNAVLGGTVVVGLVYIGMNLLSDLLYRIVDPRAR